MRDHHLIKTLLTGVISLALVAPLASSNLSPVSASAKNWVRITTNRDRLLFAKPGSRRIRYSYHNKGLHVKTLGTLRYHHQLYYRVNIKRGHHNKLAYIRASQTSGFITKSNRHRTHKGRIRKSRKLKNQKAKRRNKVNRTVRHPAKSRKSRRHTVPKVNRPKISSSKWYVDSVPTAVKDLNGFNHQVQAESLSDINQDRSVHHKRALKEDATLDKIANLRAKQTYKRFSHFASKDTNFGNAYFEKDAKKFGLNPNKLAWGENIARNDFSSNPTQIADQMNDGYMNNDANSDWGHRKNILNKQWTKVGIGSYHSNSNNETYQAEDFTN